MKHVATILAAAAAVFVNAQERPIPDYPGRGPEMTRHPNVNIVQPDTVLEFRLMDSLSSRTARPGQQFSVVFIDHGKSRYMYLPTGTKAFGHVSYVRRQRANLPGILQLEIDRLETPWHRTVPILGRIVDLRGGGNRYQNGYLVGKREDRFKETLFTGYGPENGVVASVRMRTDIGNSDIDGLLMGTLNRQQLRNAPRNVQLLSGTRFGVQLEDRLAIPRDIH